MNDINIGKKIQMFRKAKNMSIRELATAAGVTASLLSQLERNLTNPSINTMKILATALDVPLFSFFVDEESSGPHVVRADYRKKLTFPQSKDLTYELLTPDTNGSIEFLMMKLPPNAFSSELPTSHEGEEVAYVTEGEITLDLRSEQTDCSDTPDTKPLILNSGDSVRIPAFFNHRWVNHSNHHPAVVIFAITPPTF